MGRWDSATKNHGAPWVFFGPGWSPTPSHSLWLDARFVLGAAQKQHSTKQNGHWRRKDILIYPESWSCCATKLSILHAYVRVITYIYTYTYTDYIHHIIHKNEAALQLLKWKNQKVCTAWVTHQTGWKMIDPNMLQDGFFVEICWHVAETWNHTQKHFSRHRGCPLAPPVMVRAEFWPRHHEVKTGKCFGCFDDLQFLMSPFVVDFPIKNGDFPVRYVSHYQRVPKKLETGVVFHTYLVFKLIGLRSPTRRDSVGSASRTSAEPFLRAVWTSSNHQHDAKWQKLGW